MNAAFIDALADASQDGDIDLAALRTACLAKIATGGGVVAFTTNATLNGKGAAQECRADATALLGAVNQAMRIANGSAVSLTYVDFSQLQ